MHTRTHTHTRANARGGSRCPSAAPFGSYHTSRGDRETELRPQGHSKALFLLCGSVFHHHRDELFVVDLSVTILIRVVDELFDLVFCHLLGHRRDDLGEGVAERSQEIRKFDGGVSTSRPTIKSGVSTSRPTSKGGVSTSRPTSKGGVSTSRPTSKGGVSTSGPGMSEGVQGGSRSRFVRVC